MLTLTTGAKKFLVWPLAPPLQRLAFFSLSSKHLRTHVKAFSGEQPKSNPGWSGRSRLKNRCKPLQDSRFFATRKNRSQKRNRCPTASTIKLRYLYRKSITTAQLNTVVWGRKNSYLTDLNPMWRFDRLEVQVAKPNPSFLPKGVFSFLILEFWKRIFSYLKYKNIV